MEYAPPPSSHTTSLGAVVNSGRRRPEGKKVRHVFSASDYKSATQNYAQDWALLDQTLYRLCSKHPLHTDRLSVTAKVVLIGRTYATGIERKVPTTDTQGSSILQVVK